MTPEPGYGMVTVYVRTEDDDEAPDALIVPLGSIRRLELRKTPEERVASFGLDSEFVALGAWHMEPEVVARYRELLAKPRVGTGLLSIVSALESQGWQLGSMEALKRVPPGFDPDHPRARLLKLKGLGIMFPKVPAGVRHSPKLAKWIVEQSALTAPPTLVNGKPSSKIPFDF